MTVQLDNVADIYPLSPMQEGMLYHTAAEPDSSVFVSQVMCTIHGDLERRALESAWERLVRRHESLRAAFVWEGLDEPLQVIHEAVPLEWTWYDWSQEAERWTKLERFLARDRERGFDLASAPLMRMTLIRLGPDTWRWIWTCHHILCDGWSAQILLGELSQLYAAERTGKEVTLPAPFPYKGYLAWRARRDGPEDREYWSARLRGFTEPHRLEVPGLPPTEGAPVSRPHDVELGAVETAAVTAASSALRVTLHAFVAAAWSVVLSRWMRTPDVVFGVTTSGRSPELTGVEHAVGLFINTLPMRLDVAPEPAFGELARSAMSEQMAISEREHTALGSVQRWSDVPAGQPLFESIFVFENYPDRPPGGSTDLSITDVEVDAPSNYPLALLVYPGSTLRLSFVFDASRLAEDAVRSLGAQLSRVLRQVAADPSAAIASLRLTADADDVELISRACGPPLLGSEETLVDVIAQVAADRPDQTAVVDEDRALSYGGLWSHANELAARLQEAGVRKGTLVGLLFPRTVDFVTGLLAILRAGGVYVPLDPAYPPDHVRRILHNAGIGIVLTDETHGARLPGGLRRVHLDQRDTGARSKCEWEPARPDDLAYVIHTSGSTGIPKGVMVSHGNLSASTRARTTYYEEDPESFLLLSSFAFDSSIAGVFWTLASGGKLVVPPAGMEQDIARLLAFAEANRVTHLLALPSLYEIMLEESRGGEMDSLRVAIVAGESCPPDLVATHTARVPRAQLHNEYGPTEATVWCVAHEVEPNDFAGPVPIGRPIPGAQAFLLDDHGHPTPFGFAGEIRVGGAGVSRGYLNDPELTRSSFPVACIGGAERRTYRTGDLACLDRSGRLMFLGRVDAQAKVRGHRVEPTAVASTIRSLEGVADAVVRAVPAAGGNTSRLVAYVVRTGERHDVPIRDRLQEMLPAFMIPDLVIDVPVIPRLPNGKVDTHALPRPNDEGRRQRRRAPETKTEVVLARLWRELLDLEEVGIDEDYFEVGGDSLLSIRLFSRIEAETGASLPLNALLRNPTIFELGRLIDDRQTLTSGEWRSLVPLRPGGTRPAFACVHAGGGDVLFYRRLAAALPERSPVYGFEPIGLEGSERPLETVEEMAALYVSELRQVQPRGPYRIIGYCMGGVVSLEMARQLEGEGERVEMLVVVDSGIARHPSGGSQVAKIRRELHRGGWGGLASFVRQRLRARSHRLWDLSFGEPEERRHAVRSLVHRASRRALQRYAPNPIEAPILLVRSTEFACLDAKAWHMNWEEFTPNLSIVIVEAEHRTILERPQSVAAVARAIRDTLERG